MLVNNEVYFCLGLSKTSYLSGCLYLASGKEAAYKNIIFFFKPEELRIWVKKSVGSTLT